MEESALMIQYIEARIRQCEPAKNKGNGIKMLVRSKDFCCMNKDRGSKVHAGLCVPAAVDPTMSSAAKLCDWARVISVLATHGTGA
jgi:hypothetical protein